MRLLRYWKVAAVGTVAFVAIVPLLHISGPNYHHAVPHVAHHATHATPYNPYPYTAPTASPSPAASGKSHHGLRAMFLWRLAHHVRPRGWRWRRGFGIRNPIPWWLR